MIKVASFHIGFVWLDVWQEESGKCLFEPYVVKRDGSGRSAKYTMDELLCMQKLCDKHAADYGINTS